MHDYTYMNEYLYISRGEISLSLSEYLLTSSKNYRDLKGNRSEYDIDLEGESSKNPLDLKPISIPDG